jgi:hypothetical protein
MVELVLKAVRVFDGRTHAMAKAWLENNDQGMANEPICTDFYRLHRCIHDLE